MKKRSLLLLIIIFALGFINLPTGNAQSNHRAGLVIQFSDGSTQTYCVEFSEDNLSGYDLLVNTGLSLVAEFSPIGAAVCKIEADGCPASDCLTCAAPMYWSYWQLVDGSWNYALLGASTSQVTDGSVNGWVWGDGSITPPAISFDQICAPAAAAAPTATNTSVPPTPTPTATPTFTHTPEPTQAPTLTPLPTDTPSATWTVAPSDTPLATPTATQTTPPSDTPAPTWTAAPTETPLPTLTHTPTLLPTDTLVPTQAPPTPTAEPPALSANQALLPNQEATNIPTPTPNSVPAKARPSATLTGQSEPAKQASLQGAEISVAVQKDEPATTTPAPERQVSGATLLAGAMFSYAVFGLLVLGLAVGLLVIFIIGRR
jgi:hypothetical protein